MTSCVLLTLFKVFYQLQPKPEKLQPPLSDRASGPFLGCADLRGLSPSQDPSGPPTGDGQGLGVLGTVSYEVVGCSLSPWLDAANAVGSRR